MLLERHFKDYIIQNQDRKNNEIVSLITQQYKVNAKWDTKVIENIGVNALEQGMIIKVTDSKGKEIWDATIHNSGLCQQMIEHMAHNMMSRYPNWEGNYTTIPYSVLYDKREVGKY